MVIWVTVSKDLGFLGISVNFMIFRYFWNVWFSWFLVIFGPFLLNVVTMAYYLLMIVIKCSFFIALSRFNYSVKNTCFRHWKLYLKNRWFFMYFGWFPPIFLNMFTAYKCYWVPLMSNYYGYFYSFLQICLYIRRELLEPVKWSPKSVYYT